jgi:hypothetical protein
MRRFAALGLVSLSILAFVPLEGCSSKDEPAPSGPAGGPVTGTVDTHCGTLKQPTSETACRPATTDAGPTDTGATDTGSSDVGPGDAASDDAGDPGDEYGATQFNSEGDDDQCKYHVKFTVDPVRRDQDVYFTLTTKNLVDGKPLLLAKPRAEVFLDETHPAPNTDQKPVAISDGVYKVGPVRFDAAGNWTVRFHFYEDCVDGDESPHGHIAFFIHVP